MTWALSTVISLLLRAVSPLIRRGLPHLALATMAMLVCAAALASGQGLLSIALWSPVGSWPAAAVVLALLGVVIHLAALVGLAVEILLMPLATMADCMSQQPGTGPDEHPTSIPQARGDGG
ncbi:hypothetical protein [Streptomyces noursei]|uniref:hypothetical protein n=1 Tax=Streptomyces noursei TaxID=1971 RepID=UPI0038177040